MIYFEITFVVFLGLVLDNLKENNRTSNKKRSFYIVICIVLFWLMAALRNITWVASLHLDAAGYASIFQKNIVTPWSDLINDFVRRYINRVGSSDVGYDFLNKIVGLFTNDYNIFSLIVDSLFFVPFGLLLYRYTTKVRQIMVSFVFYIALIQIQMISGTRQMFALGLDIVAFMFAMDKKKIKSFLLLMLGVSLHLSSLLCLIPIVMVIIDMTAKTLKRIHIVSIVMFPMVIIFPNPIIRFMGNLVGIERYANYGANAIRGGANTFIILIALSSLFCYLAFDNNYLENNDYIRKFYVMVPIFTFFAPLINSNGSMIRISMYFYLYLMLLIPFGLDHVIAKRSQKFAYALTIVAITYLIVRGGTMDYHFMWQPL